MARAPWPLRPYSLSGQYDTYDSEQGAYGLSGWLEAHPVTRWVMEFLALVLVGLGLYLGVWWLP